MLRLLSHNATVSHNQLIFWSYHGAGMVEELPGGLREQALYRVTFNRHINYFSNFSLINGGMVR